MNWMKKWNFPKRSETIAGALTGIWCFLILTVFPLYMKDHYVKLGDGKYGFFLWSGLLLLVPAALFFCGTLLCAGSERKLGALDLAMLLYLGAALLSWVFSVDRTRAFTGANGWFMGLGTQLLFVLSYFLISRLPLPRTLLFAGHFFGSSLVFLLGLLNRFGIDPLGVYDGLNDSLRLLFLSTVGQASWYSGYLCTVLTVGVTVFFVSHSPVVRFFAGLHCVLGFSGAVTQNSDSAFFSLGFLFFGLFLASCDDPDRMECFFETVLLMLGSFKLMGVLQLFFPQRAVKLGAVSEFFSQSTATWLLFAAVALLYAAFLYFRLRRPDLSMTSIGKRLRKISAAAVLFLLAAYPLAVFFNTSGLLQDWFGFQSRNQYLLFDRQWGNSRGFIWFFTLQAFWALPFGRKLVGVGCDCFSAYCYRDAQLGARLHHFFGQNQTLTNAHNEFLNLLFCMGIVGLLAFCLLLAVAFCRFFRARQKTPLALMGALAVLAYAAHNFFCYQQICCAPYLFLILGLAENLMKYKSEKSTIPGGTK